MVREISSELNERAKKFLKSNRKESNRQQGTARSTSLLELVRFSRNLFLYPCKVFFI